MVPTWCTDRLNASRVHILFIPKVDLVTFQIYSPRLLAISELVSQVAIPATGNFGLLLIELKRLLGPDFQQNFVLDSELKNSELKPRLVDHYSGRPCCQSEEDF